MPESEPQFASGNIPARTLEQDIDDELTFIAHVRSNAARLYVDRKRKEGDDRSVGAICASGMMEGVIPSIISDGIRSGGGVVLLGGKIGPGDVGDITNTGAALELGADADLDLREATGDDLLGLVPGVVCELPGGLTIERTGPLEHHGKINAGAADTLARIREHVPPIDHIAGQLQVPVEALTATPPPLKFK